MFHFSQAMSLHVQRNVHVVSIHALLEADVACLWPDSSASAPPSPVWSAFFGHPWLFERHVLGIVAGLAGLAVWPRDYVRTCLKAP